MAEVSIHQNSAPESQEMRAVTPRSICAAIGIIVLTVLWDEWTPYYMAGSNISRSHFPLALLFPFVALAVFNMLTRLAIPSGKLPAIRPGTYPAKYPRLAACRS